MAAWKWFAGAVAAWKWPAGAVAAWNKFTFELLVLVTNGRGSGGLDKYGWCQLRKGYEWQPGQHESGESGKRGERGESGRGGGGLANMKLVNHFIFAAWNKFPVEFLTFAFELLLLLLVLATNGMGGCSLEQVCF